MCSSDTTSQWKKYSEKLLLTLPTSEQSRSIPCSYSYKIFTQILKFQRLVTLPCHSQSPCCLSIPAEKPGEKWMLPSGICDSSLDSQEYRLSLYSIDVSRFIQLNSF